MGDVDTITVTQAWQQIAVGTVTITFIKQGEGSILLNQTPSDVDANPLLPRLTEQVAENETVPTFIRATGDGWKVRVDGVLT